MIPDRMKTKLCFLPTLSALLVLGLTGGFLVWQSIPARASSTDGRKVRYLQCPMHPWVKSDQPGKCTICGMDLTPVYEGDAGAGSTDDIVVPSANSVTVLNVQTDEVKRRPLNRIIRVAGILEANESRTAIISSPAPSRIQDVAIEYTGVEVEEGQKLITLLSPELVQKRAYLNSIGNPHTVDGKPLSYVVMGSDPFSSILVAQQAGTVTQRNAFVGQYVSEGEKLLTIVDASVLWFRFDVYEQQLPWIEIGQKIEVSAAAVPGKVFPAVITFIEPALNEATRTVKVRADVDNPAVVINGHRQRRLRFGMYADGLVQSTVPDVLCVARTAVLFPDGTPYVYVDRGRGAYERRRVRLGRQGDESWEVLHGLEEGDRVVASGSVLIDAQAQFARGDIPGDMPAEDVAPAPQGGSKPVSHAAVDKVRRGIRDEMRNQRTAAIAETNGQTIADKSNPAANQPDAMAVGPTEQPPSSGPSMPPAKQPQMETMAMPVKPGQQSTQTGGAPTVVQPARTRIDVLNARRNAKDELWNMRLTAIAAAHGQNLDGSAAAIPDEPEPAGGAAHDNAMTQPDGAQPQPKPGVADAMIRPAVQSPASPGRSVQTARLNTYTPADRENIRQTLMETRTVSTSGANAQKTAESGGLTESQQQALTAFLTLADGISQALAADDLETFNQRAAQLATLLPSLQKELAPPHPLAVSIAHLAGASQAKPAPDLGEARSRFLPLSTAAVELVRALRKTAPEFSGLKIFHCPMAPEPGLWVQAKGPLANPFFGPKMLKCGEEVIE